MILTPNTQTRFVLLAPSRAIVPDTFPCVITHQRWHHKLLASMQKLRGHMYLEDGAIEPWEVAEDGRNCQEADDSSWHLLVVDQQVRVCGCVRYLEHRDPRSFEALTLRTAALAMSDVWGSKLKAALEQELATARRRAVPYVEVGGWAIAQERWRTSDAARLSLGTFALAQLLGGCLGIATATTRHHSSTILRKIGGQPLQWDGAELPPYYDPHYKCEMEMLRFDSLKPGRKYSAWIEDLQLSLLQTPVICNSDGAASFVRRRKSTLWQDAALSYARPELA